MSAEEEPDSGKLTLGSTVAPMYVEQMREDLDPDATVFEELTDGLDAINIGGREVNSRAYCSWFNFRGICLMVLLGGLGVWTTPWVAGMELLISRFGSWDVLGLGRLDLARDLGSTFKAKSSSGVSPP